MPDDRPSLAEALYPGGPLEERTNDPRAQAVIDGGIANKPAEQAANQSRPSPAVAPGSGGGSFDASKFKGLEGFQADPELMGEFSKEAKALGIGQQAGERLVNLHQKAIKAGEEAYARQLDQGVEQLRREIPAEHLQAARDLIHDPAMTPPEMRDWLLQWGNHPGVAKMLANWAGAIRRGT